MKLRSLFCLGALALAGGVVADDITPPTSNMFGWMRVDSTNAYTAVAVPWLACGGGNVKVADLVKIDNLTPGDMLFVYEGGAYKAWTLQSGAWTPTTTVASGKTPAASEPAADAALARGGALWLYRQKPMTGDAPTPFYLYGQQETEPVAAPALTAGAYNLIANPNATAFDLNGNGKIVGATAGDVIQVPGDNGIQRIYTYKDSAWGYDTFAQAPDLPEGVMARTRVTTGCTIPAGQGVWYVSKGTTAPTINW